MPSAPSAQVAIRNQYAISLDDQMSYAKAFYASGIFQDVEDEAQALVKIAKGQEIGLPPVTAMESIDIIKIPDRKGGKPRTSLFIRAHACAALINACPYADYHPKHSDDKSCTIAFSRRGPLGHWRALEDITYTFELAKRNHLVREGGQWELDAANMLWQRAMKRGCERYFPELIKGLKTVEDLPDVTDDEAQSIRDEVWGGERPTARVNGGEDVVDVVTGEVVEDDGETDGKEKPAADKSSVAQLNRRITNLCKEHHIDRGELMAHFEHLQSDAHPGGWNTFPVSVLTRIADQMHAQTGILKHAMADTLIARSEGET